MTLRENPFRDLREGEIVRSLRRSLLKQFFPRLVSARRLHLLSVLPVGVKELSSLPDKIPFFSGFLFSFSALKLTFLRGVRSKFLEGHVSFPD